MRIYVNLMQPDVRMIRVIAELQQELGCSPRRWHWLTDKGVRALVGSRP